MNRWKESKMSENRSGRKKHIVEGTVEEIKKTERSIGQSVGQRGNSFMKAIRRLLKGGVKK